MAFQGMGPPQGGQPNIAFQGMTLPQGGQPDIAFQGMAIFQGGQPNMATFQGGQQDMATPQGIQPNIAFQGMAPPQGGQPNIAFQGMATFQGGQPNMAPLQSGQPDMATPRGIQPNISFQGMAPNQGGQPNIAFQGMAPPQGGQPNMAPLQGGQQDMATPQGIQPNIAFQGRAPTQGGQPNIAFQGMAPPQGGQPNIAFQGMATPQGGQPDIAFQGMTPTQSGQPNIAFQGMAPLQGGQPNIAFQGMVPPQGGQPNVAFQGMAPPQGGQPNMAFQGMAPAEGVQPNPGMPPPQGGQIMPVMPEEDLRKTLKDIFGLAMKGCWDEVVNIYKEKPTILKEKITHGGETILHLAACASRTDIVETFVAEVTDVTVLEIVNGVSNTALHFAAITGAVRMCKCLVEKHPPLLTKRNIRGESPHFLAAQYGKKNAFLYLLSKCPPFPRSDYWRRNNGANILHMAILTESFDSAYQIIKKFNKYENSLLDLIDSGGEGIPSTLHLIGSKLAALRSGSRLGSLERLIYDCIVVDRIEETHPDSIMDDESQSKHITESPENYETCMQFCALVRGLFHHPFKEMEWTEWINKYIMVGPSTAQFERFASIMRKDAICLPSSGFINTYKIKEEKQKHTWAIQIMEELVSKSSWWDYDTVQLNRSGESPILMAARMGLLEMVKHILDTFPIAIRDAYYGKSPLHLAAENRRYKVFMYLSKWYYSEFAFMLFDYGFNSPLHLAASLDPGRQPWRTSSAVLQIQLELKWYKMVREIMPHELLGFQNYNYQTPDEVFTATHKKMIEDGAMQLTTMANSCSVVAALIATVAFSTAATIPGGFRSEDGTPTFEGKNAFDFFTVSSLIALCFSLISLITFLAILNYPYQESDFGHYLPRKMIIGFTSLLLSIAFMFASFCASHFFLLRNKLQYLAYPVYGTICFFITLFAIFQFPLYFDIIKYTITSALPDN